VISDISVKRVVLQRLGKYSVGGAVVVCLWSCVTVDKILPVRSPAYWRGGGGGLVVRNLVFSALYGTRLHGATYFDVIINSSTVCISTF
jgi:hypothetical protein